MTVTTQGAISVGAGDFRTTHRGTEIAIKVRSDFGCIVACEFVNGAWQGAQDLLFFDQDNIGTAESEIAKAGSAAMWVKTKLVPLINAWLAERFKPAAAPTPAPAPIPSSDPYAQIDAAIYALRWMPQPDGTIKVTA
jgi:hypothetical protein